MMDLGIAGKTAIVCAASKGLGRGCAEALAEAGVNLFINARTEKTLLETAEQIQGKYGVSVTPIVADITSEIGQQKMLDACPTPDILVNNAGGPPPGMWTDWEREDFINALDANMLAPIAMMKGVLPSMTEKGWGRVVNITSQSVKSPIGVLGLSTAARTGLTGYVAGTSRQVAPSGVTINNLLPGIHATERAESLDKNVSNAQGISLADAKKQREETIPARRYGTSEEFGAMCAFLCSDKAGYIVGQNILLDGGGFNSTI